MPLFMSMTVMSVAAVWLLLDQVVRRKFRAIRLEIPAAYQIAASNAPDPFESGDPETAGRALMPLAVDLMRGRPESIDFDMLTAKEKRVVLFAHAINSLPRWMVRYAALFLTSADRTLVLKLRQIHASRPTPKIQHFVNIKALQRLRSPRET